VGLALKRLAPRALIIVSPAGCAGVSPACGLEARAPGNLDQTMIEAAPRTRPYRTLFGEFSLRIISAHPELVQELEVA
jgi:hypothetical protein